MDVPILKINQNDLENFLCFIYKNENMLKEFGAIKIQLNPECKLALKKRRKNIVLRPISSKIVKINKDEKIYLTKPIDYIDESIEEKFLIRNESIFWSSLSSNLNNKKVKYLNISLLPNKSFFCQKRSRSHFGIHRLPNQSLLKLGGTQLTRQFSPCVKRAHKRGSIFPLNSAENRLFLCDYHHEGGKHYWYIIPNNQRDILQIIINQIFNSSSICFDHGQIFIDPSILDKYNIRYYKLIQNPNEFVILSSGTLTQSFTKDSSWSESIPFALPSWIEDGHANNSHLSCQCYLHQNLLSKKIDTKLFRHELIQRYTNTYLNDKSISLKGFQLFFLLFLFKYIFLDCNDIDINTIPTPNSIENNSLKGIY
jgi:hypothetical protein